MADSPNARPVQTAAPRATEGGNSTVSNKTKSSGTHSEHKRGRAGRPKGSVNRPKALIPKEVASELLGIVKQTLPPELYEEMKAAVKTGKNISTLNEARILMKLMGPPVWFRLIEETKKPPVPRIDPDLIEELGPMEPETPSFDRDLNERIKVLMGVMQFVDKLEKNDSTTDKTAQPIFELFATKGLTAARIDILVKGTPSALGGDADGVGGEPSKLGTFSGELSEGQVNVQDSEQGETVRLLDYNSVGDDAQSGD